MLWKVHLATLCSAFPFHVALCEQILTHVTNSARQCAAITLARRLPHPLDPAQRWDGLCCAPLGLPSTAPSLWARGLGGGRVLHMRLRREDAASLLSACALHLCSPCVVFSVPHLQAQITLLKYS